MKEAEPVTIALYYNRAFGCPDGSVLDFGPFASRIVTASLKDWEGAHVLKRHTAAVTFQDVPADAARIQADMAVHFLTTCFTREISGNDTNEGFQTRAIIRLRVVNPKNGETLADRDFTATAQGAFPSVAATRAVKTAAHTLIPELVRLLVD